ncbi:hypothetical protein D7V80_35235 [Corallococcus sp. CA054B]|nr:hypothetical protein D7V80_35235 [Corallococcus sp. CA054B]
MNTKTSFRRYRTLSLLVGGLLLTSCEKDPAKPDPVPDDVEQGPMNPGTHGEGELTEPGQQVRYELATKAGHFYRFSCQEDTLSRCEVRRLDPGTLEPLPPATDMTYEPTYVIWRAAVDETAIVDVRSSRDLQVKVGRYTFDFSETEDAEPNTVQDAISKEVPSDFTGVLNASFPDDVDVFRFSIPTGHILAVRCVGTSGPSNGPSSDIVRADGTVLNTYGYAGPRYGEAALSAENDTGEDLFLRVFTGVKSRPVEGYRCLTADDGVDDHPDALPEATVVTVPSTTDVKFWPEGDVDLLAVDLVEGHTYRVSSIRFPFYAATTVLDAQGTVLAKDLEDPMRLVAEFTAPSTARYFLSLRRARGDGVTLFLYPTDFKYSISDVTP